MWIGLGTSITSNNGQARLEMRVDGNLALICTDTERIIWETYTAGQDVDPNGLQFQVGLMGNWVMTL